MNNTNKKSQIFSIKKLLWVLGVFVAVALILVVLEKSHITDFIKLHPKATPTTKGPTPEQAQQSAEANAVTKKQLIENKAPNTPPANTTTPPSGGIEMSTKQETNGTVTVFTKLTGYSNGSCNLLITNGSKSTTQTAAVAYQPEYSTCAGFSVPISSVGTGNWTLTLTVTSNGSSASKTISAEVN